MLQYDLFISEDNDFEKPDVTLVNVPEDDMKTLVKLFDKYGSVNVFAKVILDDQEAD